MGSRYRKAIMGFSTVDEKQLAQLIQAMKENAQEVKDGLETVADALSDVADALKQSDSSSTQVEDK